MLDYCDIIYNCLSQRDSFRLQKIQNSALRIVLQTSKRISITELHYVHNLDTLVNRCHKHVMHYAYRGIHGMCPPSFCGLFTDLNSRYVSTTTRGSSSKNVCIPNFKLEFARKSFSYRGPMFWNLVDTNVKQADSFNQFKQLLNNSDMFD